MEQSYKIFNDTNSLTISSNLPEALKKLSITESEKELIKSEMAAAIAKFKEGGEDIDLIVTDAMYAFELLKNTYDSYIKAAGGVVFSDTDKILVIHRLGLWDLPKGKINKGEKQKVAAIREVMEETGAKNVQLGSFIANTYHMYEMKGQEVLKKTVWYKMYTQEQALKPQLEESITQAKWFAVDDLDEVYNDTYPNIQIVLEETFPFVFNK